MTHWPPATEATGGILFLLIYFNSSFFFSQSSFSFIIFPLPLPLPFPLSFCLCLQLYLVQFSLVQFSFVYFSLVQFSLPLPLPLSLSLPIPTPLLLSLPLPLPLSSSFAKSLAFLSLRNNCMYKKILKYLISLRTYLYLIKQNCTRIFIYIYKIYIILISCASLKGCFYTG